MILILAAAPLETALLRQQITNCQKVNCGTTTLLMGTLCSQDVLLGHGGIGQVNMAIQLTKILQAHSPQIILLCGCGGSYPHSGLNNGDLALATKEIFGDLGVLTENDFTPLEQLNLPNDAEFSPAIKQQFHLDKPLYVWAKKVLPMALCGTFVTVNSCSGYPALSNKLQHRTGGICENMEGAATAQVCAEFGIPLLELRGISNPTGSRNPKQWDINAATNAAQTAILRLLENWPANKIRE